MTDSPSPNPALPQTVFPTCPDSLIHISRLCRAGSTTVRLADLPHEITAIEDRLYCRTGRAGPTRTAAFLWPHRCLVLALHCALHNSLHWAEHGVVHSLVLPSYARGAWATSVLRLSVFSRTRAELCVLHPSMTNAKVSLCTSMLIQDR
jgi:hypothetical protein